MHDVKKCEGMSYSSSEGGYCIRSLIPEKWPPHINWEPELGEASWAQEMAPQQSNKICTNLFWRTGETSSKLISFP